MSGWSCGTQHQATIAFWREDHVEQLRKILRICLILFWLKDVEEVTSLKAIAELLDCLCTNTIDAKQVFLGLTDKIAYGLNANLAELVGPTL